MNIDDLAKLLKGANITVNIQGGEHNTMYTAPVQKNRYGDSERRRNDPRCSICGQSGGDLWRDSFWKSYYHPTCKEDQYRHSELEREERRNHTWQIVSRSMPMIEEAQPAPQIAAPVEAEAIDLQEQWNRDVCLYITTGSTG